MRLFPEGSRVERIAKAADRMFARVFGFSGANTLSAECGAQTPQGVCCKCLCAGMNIVEGDHCAKAARAEGLK